MLAEVQARHSTLYVTGEESLTQVHLRAKRLGLTRLDLPVLAETGVEQIIAQLQAVQPALVVLDSIQTPYTDPLASAPGSVSQLLACSADRKSVVLGQGVSVRVVLGGGLYIQKTTKK